MVVIIWYTLPLSTIGEIFQNHYVTYLAQQLLKCGRSDIEDKGYPRVVKWHFVWIPTG